MLLSQLSASVTYKPENKQITSETITQTPRRHQNYHQNSPEKSNFLGQGNIQFVTNRLNSILQSNTIDHIVGKILRILQRKRAIAYKKFPNLLPPNIKNWPRAKIQLPLWNALGIRLPVKIVHFWSWVILLIINLHLFWHRDWAFRHRTMAKMEQFGVGFRGVCGEFELGFGGVCERVESVDGFVRLECWGCDFCRV